MSNQLEWTGERLVTDIEGVLGVAEHLHRYALACDMVEGKSVLDIASGEGYGSHLLSKKADSVIGVDISEEAVEHANSKYARKTNLSYRVGSASSIPLEDNSVDIVTSFETLEHTTEHDAFLQEIKRVLKPGGVLIMSTPDTVLYKPHDPNNPYHVKELTTNEFEKLIGKYFRNSTLLNQRSVIGTLVLPVNKEAQSFKSFSGKYSEIIDGYGNDVFYGKPLFNIIVASDKEINQGNTEYATLFNYVPDFLNEFNGSIGLMFELQELKKLASRLDEIENSKSYRFAQTISKILRLGKK